MTLRAWLTKYNVSVTEFADRIGVSSEAVYRYCNGTRRPRWRVLLKITAETGGIVTANSFVGLRQAA